MKYMELSIFLAKLMGLYLIVVCSAALVQRKKLEKLIDSFGDNQALMVVTGALFLILGLAVVLTHNIWTRDWRVIITVLGWLTLVKSGLRLFAADKLKPIARKFMKIAPIVWLVFLALGVYLAYTGFSY